MLAASGLIPAARTPSTGWDHDPGSLSQGSALTRYGR